MTNSGKKQGIATANNKCLSLSCRNQADYYYAIRVRSGIVNKHKRVLSRTQFAASSVSLWCISASPIMTDAHGTPDKTSILILNDSGSGRKYTAR